MLALATAAAAPMQAKVEHDPLTELRAKMRADPDSMVARAKERYQEYVLVQQEAQAEPMADELWHMRELNVIVVSLRTDGDGSGSTRGAARAVEPSEHDRPRSRTPTRRRPAA